MDNTAVWNAPGHDQPLLDALHGTLEEVIGVAHANPHWWNSNVLRHPYRRRVVGTFLNWYLNGQLPPNYDDQRGTIAYRYMNNLLTRFYDNPTLLLPVNNTVTVADPMVRNLRPRRQRRRLRRGDGDKENRPPTAGGALIPEAFYSKRTELNQLIADYATHNFMGFQEWRSTVPSITNEFMLHSQAQIQAEIEKMQGLIDQLRQIQASNWQRYAVGGSLNPQDSGNDETTLPTSNRLHNLWRSLVDIYTLFHHSTAPGTSQAWLNRTPSLQRRRLLLFPHVGFHSERRAQELIALYESAIADLQRLQAAGWPSVTDNPQEGGSVAPSTPTARAGRTREATIRAIVEPIVQSGRITVRDRRIAIASIMRQLHVGRVEAEDLFFSAVGQLLD